MKEKLRKYREEKQQKCYTLKFLLWLQLGANDLCYYKARNIEIIFKCEKRYNCNAV